MWLYFGLIAHLCHLYLIAQATNVLVSVSLLMNSSKHNLRPPIPCLKLQVKCSRCWLFYFLFFHIIRFQASILVTWHHGRLFFWGSAESRFDCALLILDACTLMTRRWIRHLLYSQLYYLWKSFGILLHMTGEVHSRGVYSKHWIMNDACERSWIKSQLKLRWVFSFLSS